MLKVLDDRHSQSGVKETTPEYPQDSGQVVRDAIGAMGQIGASSREISNTIGVIDEIAFQTNLLALNAGI
ncbi:methyl-accepting chemotaxis protein (MCP) signaling protein [Rhizobium sp. PP-F2F-G38]|nr:methyl-accepting chemotaxis protein (MCP) signaling protein [Rhizobium sp. PP-WC-1G-195]PYE39114.1 methyl-accepting chemotaxis protein (MCP) signaling protein [Rhizobium sp. PP-F2F-G20b]PYE93309.1 methyl-accepting chemotaxis protein (MCP) signaling protein [Rhizobium sp. PP-F2F-G38]TCL89418.1 methyl-accepting chemotaxis protein (MCP) signaling protein [Rhizobium sp. PP-WC-2G-219]TCP75339.1 methyl-accepting chemotaxis protein (MCP) signaling protein [Rhizobium sp. PP-CC-2G-626]TCQ02564.1 met